MHGVLGVGLGVIASGLLSAAAPSPVPATGLIAWPAQAKSPTFELLDERARLRTPADFRGRVFVVLFGFARCPDGCPAELFKLSSALRQLPHAGRDVQVLFITLDPVHDSHTLLKDYVQTFNPRFHGLTGSEAQVEAASSSFHVTYAHVRTGGDYTVDHSSAVFLFDARGRLRLLGTADTSVGEYARGLAELLAKKP